MNPSDATISTIAHQLIENRTVENLQFWGVYGVLALILAAIVAVTTAYFLERGKLLAATNNLASRLDDIRKTTEASERVRTQIAHSDWTVKELKTLRRTKLEQMVTASYDLAFLARTDSMLPEGGDNLEMKSITALAQIRLCSLLYFPELESNTNTLAIAHGQLILHVVNSRSEIGSLRRIVDSAKLAVEQAFEPPSMGSPERQAKIDEFVRSKADLVATMTKFSAECILLIRTLTVTLKELQDEASMLIATLIKPTV